MVDLIRLLESEEDFFQSFFFSMPITAYILFFKSQKRNKLLANNYMTRVIHS